MESKDTKELILQKTFYLLLLKGYDGVSISDIQKETGMARGLLYHYFGSKAQLFVEAAKLYLVKALDSDLDLVRDYTIPGMIGYMLGKYKAACSNNWADFPIEEHISLANYDFLIYRMIEEHEDIREKYIVLRRKELEAWEFAVSNSLKRNEIREVMPPYKIARYFDCLVDGVWTGSPLYEKEGDLVAQLDNMLQGFYNIIKV